MKPYIFFAPGSQPAPADSIYVKCPCQHCGALIRFDEAYAGQTQPCPHCAKDTVLLDPRVPKPPPEPPPAQPPAPKLGICPDCGRQVSLRADACPGCGCTFRRAPTSAPATAPSTGPEFRTVFYTVLKVAAALFILWAIWAIIQFSNAQ